MKYKLGGLFVILVGAALVSLTVLFKDWEMLVRIALIASGILCVICGAVMLKKQSEHLESKPTEPVKEDARYAAKNAVLTQPEIRLCGILRQMLGNNAEILPQVALVSIVDKLNYKSYRNELFRIIDFVICDLNFRPVAAVELNDSSHKRKERIERDQKVAGILSKAGIRLVTIEIEELDDYNKLRKKIYSAIK